jgi:hypothetical protein
MATITKGDGKLHAKKKKDIVNGTMKFETARMNLLLEIYNTTTTTTTNNNNLIIYHLI